MKNKSLQQSNDIFRNQKEKNQYVFTQKDSQFVQNDQEMIPKLEDFDEIEALRNQIKHQTFIQCTQGQNKIWRLFKSLDCPQCKKMYNDKQRKPHIVCANNHLLCKSCFSKIRQSSYNCPFCKIRMSTKNTSSHESIQMFLRIYNEIFQEQKSLIEQKKKKNNLQFQIPKNLKTIVILLLIIVTPWIFDALKYLTTILVDFEYKILTFLYNQISQIFHVIKTIIQDEFYIHLFTNQNGQYIYHGDDIFSEAFNINQLNTFTINNLHENLYTLKHKIKIQAYLKIIYVVGYLWEKFFKVGTILAQSLNYLNYFLHFIVIIVGTVQFPFLIPIILLRIQHRLPRKFQYRIVLYLQLIEAEQLSQCSGLYIEPEEVQKLSKGQLYACLLIKNYIQWILKMYKSVETDMKKRCDDLQYKKRMRLLKKSQKQMSINSKVNKNTGSKLKFTF